LRVPVPFWALGEQGGVRVRRQPAKKVLWAAQRGEMGSRGKRNPQEGVNGAWSGRQRTAAGPEA